MLTLTASHTDGGFIPMKQYVFGTHEGEMASVIAQDWGDAYQTFIDALEGLGKNDLTHDDWEYQSTGLIAQIPPGLYWQEKGKGEKTILALPPARDIQLPGISLEQAINQVLVESGPIHGPWEACLLPEPEPKATPVRAKGQTRRTPARKPGSAAKAKTSKAKTTTSRTRRTPAKAAK